MPVVRYRTRDITSLLPGTARPMRRLRRVSGRSDDMIVLRGVNLFPSQIEELILRVPSLSPHFQCVLTRPGRTDELTVRVERRPDADAGLAGEYGKALAGLVKNSVGVTVHVDVTDPETVERSAGKMRRIVDQRTPM
jgi:phenylacetate-CoA ligase